VAPIIAADAKKTEHQHFLRQLRLFLEEICCEICRFRAAGEDGTVEQSVVVAREVDLGLPGAFADAVVSQSGKPTYFLEVKYGYAADRMIEHFKRKYARPSPKVPDAKRVILVVDTAGRADWPQLARRVREATRPDLELEIWDEARLQQLIRECFELTLPSVTPEGLSELRGAIDDQKWLWAFGEEHSLSGLKSTLLWNFGYSRLQQLHRAYGLTPEQILPPQRYRNAIVLLADLSSFSSFVRDTRDDEVMRNALTTFYSNSRYAIINAGGMMCQFVGDEVIAVFGIPDRAGDCSRQALECARSLLQIGSSVSNRWQREIDRVQPSGGVHVGIAMGDIQAVLYRPFCRTHVGIIGDAVNLASRLLAQAEADEIVVSNTYFQGLPDHLQRGFQELEPIEARNIGLIKGWRLREASSYSTVGA
jgi:class 3 adenylate cyclase